MKKHNQVLIAVLALQVALVALIFWPRSAASGGESEPLLGDLASGDIVALTIEDADGERLALSVQTGSWTLPEADGYPAQDDKIAELLEKLTTLNTGRLVTRTGASHKRLQVARDNFVRRIDLDTAEGKKYTLYIGSSPSNGAVHIRLEGENETYLTSNLNTWEIGATPNSWVNTQYLSVVQDNLIAVTLQNANGEWTLLKDDEGMWTLAGLAQDEELDSSGVNGLVNQASAVTLLRPLGTEEKPSYGLDQPQAVVTLQSEEKTITLYVGVKHPQDNSYVVKSSESPYYVRVNEFSVKNLVETARDDFLQLPPTPTPEQPAGEGG